MRGGGAGGQNIELPRTLVILSSFFFFFFLLQMHFSFVGRRSSGELRCSATAHCIFSVPSYQPTCLFPTKLPYTGS